MLKLLWLRLLAYITRKMALVVGWSPAKMRKMNPGFASALDTNYYANVVGVGTTDGGYTSVPGRTKPYNLSCTGAAIRAHCFQFMDGTAQLFVGTSSNIYKLASASAYNDVSRVSAYTTATSWNFCQLGDYTIAASIENALQYSGAGGGFTDAPDSPPKAKYCATLGLAVVLGHYDDGSLYEDGWWVSDAAMAAWTPSASNDAAYGRLLQTPGPITGIATLRNKAYLFKENSFYSLEYVGYPIVYQVNVVNYSVGASNQSCILTCEDTIIFGNKSGFYSFDGQSVRSLSDGRRTQILTSNSITESQGCYYDQKNKVAYFGAYLSYNVATDSWGTTNLAIRTMVMGTEAAINSDLPSTATALGSMSAMVANSTNSDLYNYDKNGTEVYIYTNVHGGPTRKTTWKRFTPVFKSEYQNLTFGASSLIVYTSSNCTFTLDNSTATLTDSSPLVHAGFTFSNSTPVRWDFLKTNNYAQFFFSITSSANPAVPIVVYDYILGEVDAGTD